MPKRKGKKRKGRRRGKGSGGSGYGLTGTENNKIVNRTPFTGVVPRFLEKFDYEQLFTISNATLTATQQTFNLNSCFDPDRSGGGHQPLCWDVFAGTLYNRYRVLRAKWRVSFGPANSTVFALAGPMNSLPPVAITDLATFQAAAELPRFRDNDVPATGKDLRISASTSLNQLATNPLEYLTDDRYEAVYSSSPSEVISLVTAVYNPNTSTVITQLRVKITYYVDLHDVIAQGASYYKKRVEHLRKANLVRMVDSQQQVKIHYDTLKKFHDFKQSLLPEASRVPFETESVKVPVPVEPLTEFVQVVSN